MLFYVTQQAPFGSAMLIDTDVTMDFNQVNADDNVMTVVATTPLTDNESWQQLAVNECVIFKAGSITYQDRPDSLIYLSVEKGSAMDKKV